MTARKKPKPQDVQLLSFEQQHADHPDDQHCPGCDALRVASSRIDDIEDILLMRFSDKLSDKDINGVILGSVLRWAITFTGSVEFDEPYRSILRDIEARLGMSAAVDTVAQARRTKHP